MPDVDTDLDYNSEPVSFCSKCYSLNIQYVEDIDADCCMECGCSDISTDSIERWEALYKNRYGHSYVERNADAESSFIFSLPLSKIKNIVFDSPFWKYIIRKIYPRFPLYLGRVDSLIVFFDKIVKDNKLKELKYLLTTDSKLKSWKRKK